MAETSKAGAKTSANAVDATADASPTNQAAPDVPGNPLPKTVEESDKASVRVSTVWPTSEFHAEGLPVIRQEGTMLTKAQVKQIEEVAAANNVAIHIEEGE